MSAIKKRISVDEASTWEEIRRALGVFKIELEPMQGVGSQRLIYEDFERIFYQLFLLIDGPGTRRKFRLIYPAKDRDKREQFIESTIAFINIRRLMPQPLTKCHLRAFGGEPFRKLLSILVRQAKETEIKQTKKYLTSYENEADLMAHELNSITNQELDLMSKVEQKLKIIDENIESIKRYFERR